MKEMVYSNEWCACEILEEGTINGHKYAIISKGIYPVAYVENKLSNVTEFMDDRFANMSVHCGFSYLGEAYWDETDKADYLGWDYGHLCDYNGMYNNFWAKCWTVAEIRSEVKYVIRQLVRIENKEKGE